MQGGFEAVRRAEQFPERGQGARLVLSNEAAIVNNIGGQERGEATPHTSCRARGLPVRVFLAKRRRYRAIPG